MHIFKKIIALSRPRFWMYTAGPYLLGFTLATDNFFSSAYSNFLTFWYVFFFFLIPANIIIYGVNDLFDEESDKINPKKESHEVKISLSLYKLYKYSIGLSLLLFLPLIFIINAISLALLLIFFFLAIFYSVPPLRFKTRPLLDSASNILYAIPGLVGYVQMNPNLDAVLQWDVLVPLLCWTAALHLFSAIPDIKYDVQADMTTTATTLGKEKSLWLCAVLWTITATLLTYQHLLFFLLFLYPGICFALILNKSISLTRIYWLFPSLNALLGCIYFWLFALNIL